MSAGTGALRLGETLLGPAALPPPPTRHALLALIVALAALLHLGTVQWGDLDSTSEGQYAGSAREMLQGGHYLLPTNVSIPRLQQPPLLYWLLMASYQLLGVSTAAARVPIAFATIATTALTFLLGERLAGFWRGFTASLIFLTCSGTFIFGRMVIPEPLFTAFIAGAVYCGLAGLQERKRRPLYYAGFWCCAALACLTQGPQGLLVPAAILGLLAIFHREIRMRLRALFWWPYLLLFLGLALPWYVGMEWHLHDQFHRALYDDWIKTLLGRQPSGAWFGGVPRHRFILLHLAWLFPWSLAVIPALLLSWRRVMRPREIDLSDALPLVWMIVVFAPLLLIGQRRSYYALCNFPAFALWAAMIWERAPVRSRLVACLLAGASAITIGALVTLMPGPFLKGVGWMGIDSQQAAWHTLHTIPPVLWLSLRPLLAIAALTLVLGAGATAYLSRRNRDKLAVLGLALAMIPTGLGLTSAMGRISPYFSLAEAARFLNSHLGPDGKVLFEGSPGLGSSLGFYLDRKFALVNQTPEPFPRFSAEGMFLPESAALDELAAPQPVYLVIDQERVRYWRELLTQRFHAFHQVASCGRHLVLSNQF